MARVVVERTTRPRRTVARRALVRRFHQPSENIATERPQGAVPQRKKNLGEKENDTPATAITIIVAVFCFVSLMSRVLCLARRREKRKFVSEKMRGRGKRLILVSFTNDKKTKLVTYFFDCWEGYTGSKRTARGAPALKTNWTRHRFARPSRVISTILEWR